MTLTISKYPLQCGSNRMEFVMAKKCVFVENKNCICEYYGDWFVATKLEYYLYINLSEMNE